MDNWQPDNPVERRLMLAHEDWLCFARARDARVMIWQTDETDAQIVQLYFQGQQDVGCCVFDMHDSFVDGSQYSRMLSQEVIRFYDARREASAAQGMRADWQAPREDASFAAGQARDAATGYLLAVLGSLMDHHPDVFPGIVLVLQPDEVSDHAALEHWLEHLLQALNRLPALSGRLRIVLPAIDPEPFARLAARRPAAVRIIHGRYAMQGLGRELLAQSGERGSSGGFRRLFVELTEAVGHGDPAKLELLRAAALQIAQAERWPDQVVVVHLLAASAHLKRHDFDGALAAYREAGAAASQAVAQNHPAGHKLAVNALFGEASVHLMRHAHPYAAQCYERAAAAAAAARDPVLGVEAWRMSALCWHRSGERDHALEAGFHALDAGLGIEASQRANSNLRLAAEWMIQHTGASGRQRRELDERFDVLFSDG
ncbi:hypothetical protein PPGU19_090890 (plasmid) [Paraburkholderia sp. PGU19]|uniref:hypothetical protein n=1 Tax=Paraburkholderia sp. PGU19 TaxID=2735434 RepID=UPI0015D9B0DF|nr:hypothetical protein [Paraburkholderia sp. PGU19]BCG04521.1 hypothetical protein PPGU19_090890 [Paraburkholderia sp. PGU19]